MAGNCERRRLQCLWMDLKTSTQVVETPVAFARHCDVAGTSGFDEARLCRDKPDFAVIEFDYPSRSDLARAAAMKLRFPSVPMIVVTVQHSESLAVWFFRERFYDYLVQPLSGRDVANCMKRLVQILPLSATQPSRSSVASGSPFPLEAGSQQNRLGQLGPAIALVERDYHQRLRVSDAAAVCGLAPLRFGRQFKERFGVDFREYVVRYRIREACRLLRNPQSSVTEVCYSVGFSEPSYFTRMFRKLVGKPPSAALGDPTLDLPLPFLEPSRNY